MEIDAGKQLIDDVLNYKPMQELKRGLNVVSCPSCSRVENEAFVELAQIVEKETEYANEHNITIAVMGCRVNGPGETNNADIGLWCGPTHVNLKRGSELIGQYTYDKVLTHLKEEVEHYIESQ